MILRFRSSLKKLSFEGCFTEAGFVAIGEALQQYPSTGLETLELDDWGRGRSAFFRDIVLSPEGAISLARGIETNASLRNLSLDFMQITADGSLRILNSLVKNRSLVDVAFSGLDGSNAEFWPAVARVLVENETITYLALKSYSRDALLTTPIDFDPIAIALAENKTLEVIVMDHWDFDAPTLHTLVHGLLQNDTLEEIFYRGARLNRDSIGDICRLVSGRKRTKTLDLTDDGIGDDLLVPLCEALRHATGLECLKLCQNAITDTGTRQLTEMLRANHELKHLHMTEHSMSDEGFIALAKALEANNTLESLSLSSSVSQVSSRGIEALVNGVKNNKKIIQLDLPSPELWPTSLTERLNVYLERNKVVYPLLKADIPLGLWPFAMERAHLCNPASPDMLFLLIKEKCDLFCSVPLTRKRKRRRTRR